MKKINKSILPSAHSAEAVRVLFDGWAGDHHASGMEEGHWPVVRQAFELIVPSSGSCLEIGVGNGYGTHHLATHQYKEGMCYGIDISPSMIEQASRRAGTLPNVKLEAADFFAWPKAKELRFTLIFSMEVFYYFPDIQKALDRACSMLEPGGMLMVLVEYFRENPGSHSWPKDLGIPMQLWSEEEYLKGFERAGLVQVEQGRFLRPKPSSSGDEGVLGTWGYRRN